MLYFSRMKRLILLFIAAAAVGSLIGVAFFFGQRSVSAPSRASSGNNAVASAPAANKPTPPPSVNGPASHSMVVATSTDGLTFTVGKTLLTQASVPMAVLNDDGSVRTYYVDASHAPEGMNCADLSADRASATVLDCSVSGLPDGMRMLDPAAVRLPDGGYRLYFYMAPTNQPVNTTDAHSVSSAISVDGVHFTYEGIAFSYGGLVDPDIFWDGTQWNMYVFSITDQATVVATSPDGLSFTYQGPLGIGAYGTSTPVRLDDGTFRLYVFDQKSALSAFESFTSPDAKTWTKEAGTRLEAPAGMQITDAQAVHLKDGSWLMVFKENPLLTSPNK